MKTEYKKLFELRLKHSFYSDGKSQDFDILPSEETKTMLKNLRLLLRIDSDGATVYYQSIVGSSAAFIDFSNRVFRFGLMLKNLYFSNITNLPAQNSNINNYIAPPSGGGFELDTDSVLKATIFSYNIQSATRPLNVKLKKGASVKQTTVIQDITENACRIDMTGFADGSYKIIEETTDVMHTQLASTNIKLNNAVTTVLTKDFLGRSIHSVVEITASATPVASPYTVSFTASKSAWEYYLILNKTNSDVFTIQDEGDAHLNFGAAASVPVPTLASKISIPADSKIWKIVSSATVPFSDNPKTRLKLIRNGDSGNPIYLGNPTATSLKTELFVYL